MQALLFCQHNDESAALTAILQQAGFSVRSLSDLERAIEAWPEQPSDLILITLYQGEESALTYVKQMRAHTATPMVVLVDSVSEDFQVQLLEGGADLVVDKPYSVRLLLGQIRALLRRSAGVPFFSLPTLEQGDLSLDPGSRTVVVEGGQPTHLTQLEFRLLYTLMTHSGQVLPAENIVEHVWGYSGEGNRQLVRGLVQRLRSKVEPDTRNPRYILTEPGVGYRFRRP